MVCFVVSVGLVEYSVVVFVFKETLRITGVFT